MKTFNINNYIIYPVLSNKCLFLLFVILIFAYVQSAVAMDSVCTPSDRIQIGFNYKNTDGSWDPNEFNINNYLVPPVDKLQYLVARYGLPNEGNTNIEMYLIHPAGTKSQLNVGSYALGSVRFLESSSYKLENGEYRIEVYESQNCYSLLFPLQLKKTLVTGETWDLGNGYTLTVRSIDARGNPRQVWLVLNKEGNQLNDKVISMGEIYSYNNIFSTKVDSIFPGATTDMVQLKETIFSITGIPKNSSQVSSVTGSQATQGKTQSTQVPTYVPTPIYSQSVAIPQQETINWGSYIPLLGLILTGIVIYKFTRKKLPDAINYSKEKKEEAINKIETSKKEISSSIDHVKDSAQKSAKQAVEALAVTKNIAARIAKEEIEALKKTENQGQSQSSRYGDRIDAKTTFGYKGATIIYKVKIENTIPAPIADIKVSLYVPDVFLLAEKEKSLTLLKPGESKTVTFEIRPTGECGNCEVSGKLTYYNTANNRTKETDIESKMLSIVCPILKSKEISEDEWSNVVRDLIETEESTKEIDMPAETLFTMTSRLIKDMHMHALKSEITQNLQILNAVARFYGEGVKGLRYAAQVEVIGGGRKSKLILKAWAEKEEALTGFYHGILDKIEKRINIKGYIEEPIIQKFIVAGNYVTGNVGKIIDVGDKTVQIGTQVKDSFIQRSTIGAGARKCPNCGREVEVNEKFCFECGAKL